MGATTIEWAEHSINPLRARNTETGAVGHYCELCSAGCGKCYSSRWQPRFGLPMFGGAGRRPPNIELFLDESALDEVRRRRKPTRYFWCDMTDMFGAWVPFEWIARCFAAMRATPQHTHMLLTKRPQRALEFYRQCANSLGWITHNGTEPEKAYRGTGIVVGDSNRWPLPNVWIGTSVENQAAADERIPALLQIPAAVRFLSCEPLLGKVVLADDGGDCEDCGYLGGTLHWVIAGGESGPGARPAHPNWFRSLRNECADAGVPFFFKQWGEWGAGRQHRARHDRRHHGRRREAAPGPEDSHLAGRQPQRPRGQGGRRPQARRPGVEWPARCAGRRHGALAPREPLGTNAVHRGGLGVRTAEQLLQHLRRGLKLQVTLDMFEQLCWHPPIDLSPELMTAIRLHHPRLVVLLKVEAAATQGARR